MRRMLVVTPQKCTGCRICEQMCSFHHTGTFNPALSRIKVVRWETDGIDVPMTCFQCEEPLCAQACPTHAIYRDQATGAMKTRDSACMHCRFCVMACPFGGTSVGSEGRIIRCDLCEGDPSCVRFCQTGALAFVRMDLADASRKREEAGRLVGTARH